MAKDMGKEFNRQLDALIEERRSIRAFTDQVPSGSDIEAIIRAGLQAPYAAPAVAGTPVFRRFFVFERGSKSMDALPAIVKRTMTSFAEKLQRMCDADPARAEKAGPFLGMLRKMAEADHFPMQDAPYFIVIGEKRGIPPSEFQSLAHVLQNMWLKATALGLGLRLISMTEQMGNDEEFCRILGMGPGEFAYDGCTVGYATEWPPAAPRPAYDEAVAWMP